MMEQTQQGKELSRINFSDGYFMANGHKYVIENQFSIERWVMKEDFERELGFGVDFKGIFDDWHKVYELANQTKFADIAVLAYNKVKGLEKISEREPVVLKLCALFCNREDENRAEISEDIITGKINDWKKEGIAIGDFFGLALTITRGLLDSYKSSTEIISK